jgi:HAE1 family hydrophobic/amphiphilic exporter-1
MSLGDVTNTMQILMGSAYVNDFDFNGRSYRVYVQADQQFRSNPADIAKYQVRTSTGHMTPLSNIVAVREATAPKSITHFNLFRSATINGSAAPGFSSGEALQTMAELSDRVLPTGVFVRVVRRARWKRSRRARSRRDLRPRPAARST